VSRSSPDYLEPFIGWKGLIANPSTGMLCSPRGDHWPPRERFGAECDRGHVPPSANCSCGVYAVKTFEELRGNGYNWEEVPLDENGVWVVAQIKLWGQVRRGRIGYRAQYAYPQKVYVPAHKLTLGRTIKQRYGCAIGVIDRFTGERR
jgi:hypothetical protein